MFSIFMLNNDGKTFIRKPFDEILPNQIFYARDDKGNTFLDKNNTKYFVKVSNNTKNYIVELDNTVFGVPLVLVGTAIEYFQVYYTELYGKGTYPIMPDDLPDDLDDMSNSFSFYKYPLSLITKQSKVDEFIKWKEMANDKYLEDLKRLKP